LDADWPSSNVAERQLPTIIETVPMFIRSGLFVIA
jgi:hypothetical protein